MKANRNIGGGACGIGADDRAHSRVPDIMNINP